MAEIYFTIAGTHHHHGQEFIEPKMEVKLVKEPENEYDTEAIKVEELIELTADIRGEAAEKDKNKEYVNDTKKL